MKHFLLLYDVGPDFIERREQFRSEHLERAWAAQRGGALVLAGALAPPTDTAVLLFQGESAAVAEAFAKSDPYVTNGLVKAWRVREWKTVVGENAASPVRLR